MQVTNPKVDDAIALQNLPTPFERPKTWQQAAKTATPPAPPSHDEDLPDLVRWFEEAEDATADAREKSERDRDYYDGQQWTPEELEVFRKRKQPALVINYIKRKIEIMRGMERRQRSDPKAFPRNPGDEQAAEAATDALRFIADQNDFDETRSSVYENMAVEGYGGCDVIAEQEPNGEIRIAVTRVPWDRLVYDPHSRLPDFSDANYKGIVIWMDGDEARRQYGEEFADAIDATFKSVNPGDTYGDRPGNAWCDSKRKRVRVVQMHYKRDDEWYLCTYTKGGFLSPPEISPYVDKYGQSISSLIIRSAYIDRKNNRYGAVRDLISLQDELNKRRSKMLHLMNVRQTFGARGAVQDAQAARVELAKPDGHVELVGGMQFGKDFGVLPTGDLAAAQFQLLQHATQEMQASGPNAAMAGKGNQSQSGRAWEAQQQAGAVEMEPLTDELRQWTRDVYEAVWLRVKQFWTDQVWIRVTDDDRNIKFVGLNRKVTLGDKLKELAEQNPQEAQQLAQQMGVQSPYDPRLKEVISVDNVVSELDVDIVIEEGPDVAVLQSEQFEQLAKLAQNGMAIPPKAIIQASSLRNKDAILDEMESGKQLPPEVQKQMQEMQQQLQQLSQENQALKGNRDLDLAKLALENKKVDQADRHAQLSAAQQQAAAAGQGQPMPEPMVTPKDAADIDLKRAQTEKTLADAEKVRLETIAQAAELQNGGTGTELDPETGETLPPKGLDALAQVAAQTLAAVQAVDANLAGYISAPRRIVRGPNGEPLAVQVGELPPKPVITDETGRIAGTE